MSKEIEKIIISSLSRGEDSAIMCPELCKITGLNEREVRLFISSMRLHGVIICSSSKGYFFPDNITELEAFIMQEKSRARSINKCLKPAEDLLKKWKRGE